MAADQTADESVPTEERFASPSAYNGSLSIYGWLPWMSGDAGVKGVGPVSFSLSPKDILEILDFTMMASGDVHSGPYGLFADFIYLKVSKGKATPGPLFSSANLSQEAIIASLAATYQVYESGDDWAQVFAGARYWSFDTGVKLGAGILPAISGSADIHWVDPMIGVRGQKALSDKWYLSGVAAIGGFGVGSDLMWDVYAGVGYRFTDTISMAMGYRAFSVDYSNNGNVIDLVSQGPLMGLTFRF
jgi:hypothetical protein